MLIRIQISGLKKWGTNGDPGPKPGLQIDLFADIVNLVYYYASSIPRYRYLQFLFLQCNLFKMSKYS